MFTLIGASIGALKLLAIVAGAAYLVKHVPTIGQLYAKLKAIVTGEVQKATTDHPAVTSAVEGIASAAKAQIVSAVDEIKSAL